MHPHTAPPSLLPGLLTDSRGQPVRTPADWRRRRDDLLPLILTIEYGGLPPAPAATHLELLNSTTVARFDGATYLSCRVVTENPAPFSFMLYLLIPQGDGPFPVIINGDACWRYVTDEITMDVLRRGYILAQFNRVEIVPDVAESGRTLGLYRIYPNAQFGALAAWAWGYHRCIDVLHALPQADPARIAITGHSRGGKTTLLAGATDERIALTNANNSGAGGAGCFRYTPPGAETLADLLRVFPFWFGPQLQQCVGREHDLPFDQHVLKALIAPRALLTTEARGDAWANPEGTWLTHEAARPVFRLLNAEDQLGIVFRDGGHAHTRADWHALLDFADWRLRGLPPARTFAAPPAV